MHIRNDPSFFLTNKTGDPQGEELGLIKSLSDSFCSYSDNFSFRMALTDQAPVYRCSTSDLMFSGDGDTDGGSDDEGSATTNSVMHASADGDRGVWC
ncbi:hypothetical protein Tco_1417970 [Tanacetum coccineum]